jgi:glycine/D-amino acid oxidase-like deaminating enzyme
VLADGVAEIGDWCAEHDVDCWFHHEGVLGVRTGTWQDDPRQGALAFLERLGLGDRIQPRTLEECRRIADSPRFIDGAFGQDGAVVQPGRLARGLRRVALDQGVRIFERTALTGLDRSRPAVVRTEHGAVKAAQVVLAMGSWSARWRGFRRSFGVVVDHMVVTEPLGDRLADIGWTSMTGIADGRDMLFYLRPTDDGRIAIGGGSLGVVMGGRASGRAATHDRHAAEVAARGLLWMFPQLEGIAFEHAWGGPIDQTASFLPFFKTLAPGNVHAGAGFSGHGLVQTYVGGKILSSLVQGAQDEWTSLPVVGPEPAKAPPEPLRYAAVRAAALALEAGDRRQDAGRSRGALNDVIGSAPLRLRERLVARGPGRAQ